MKPRVIVEQLDSRDHIWDNSVLKLPAILSSPSLDCSTQYKEMLSFVAAELESGIQNCDPEGFVSVEPANHCIINLNMANKDKRLKIQSRKSRICPVNVSSFKASTCYESPQQRQTPSFSTSLSDPFDDFISLDDTQQLLKNCNVFHNETRKPKVEKSLPSLALHMHPVNYSASQCRSLPSCGCPLQFRTQQRQTCKL